MLAIACMVPDGRDIPAWARCLGHWLTEFAGFAVPLNHGTLPDLGCVVCDAILDERPSHLGWAGIAHKPQLSPPFSPSPHMVPTPALVTYRCPL